MLILWVEVLYRLSCSLLYLDSTSVSHYHSHSHSHFASCILYCIHTLSLAITITLPIAFYIAFILCLLLSLSLCLLHSLLHSYSVSCYHYHFAYCILCRIHTLSLAITLILFLANALIACWLLLIDGIVCYLTNSMTTVVITSDHNITISLLPSLLSNLLTYLLTHLLIVLASFLTFSPIYSLTYLFAYLLIILTSLLTLLASVSNITSVALDISSIFVVMSIITWY